MYMYSGWVAGCCSLLRDASITYFFILKKGGGGVNKLFLSLAAETVSGIMKKKQNNVVLFVHLYNESLLYIWEGGCGEDVGCIYYFFLLPVSAYSSTSAVSIYHSCI